MITNLIQVHGRSAGLVSGAGRRRGVLQRLKAGQVVRREKLRTDNFIEQLALVLSLFMQRMSKAAAQITIQVTSRHEESKQESVCYFS